ncbi:hypothetical protein MSMTP_1493 [Methanosarcina sp. MTP4]|uniref:type II toxin-antitoxin system HicB family antitoxin n=1 Tax=Methanosarcina sp. MTP4 TaxID=1434100 RepID=UPI000615EBA6|nr:type II toxin-antitoxin system HicB family antitoxin [Methanosarcina sp. MTP4]AKB24962.1 hypothetical protein MSMTP_1493 [Methanosarcina sp. MTP4]
MQFTVRLEESEEGGYTAQCLELPAAISEGDTKEEALENIKEAIQLVLEVTREQSQVLGEVTKVDVPIA